MDISLKFVNDLEKRGLVVEVYVDGELKSNKLYLDEIDYYLNECDLFEEVIRDIRQVCKAVGRHDLVKALKMVYCEYTETRDDEYDSYYREITEYTFPNGFTFEYVLGDYDEYYNVEFKDLIEFINKKIFTEDTITITEI